MERFAPIDAVIALALLALPCSAQEARSIPASAAPQPVVRQKASLPAPFSFDEAHSAAPVEFLSDNQISQPDRALLANSLVAISQRAHAAGLNFEPGSWQSQQIVCSALPGHLFLAFTRDSGQGDTSAFTASIPRGAGQLRLIPILRRGYSPFSPAPSNAITIAAFNQIRAEEYLAQPPDWLATSLCYAALAGAHPRIGSTGEANQPPDLAAAPAGLTTSAGSGGEISILVLDANSRRNQWTMSFDGSGKLLTVALAKSPNMREQVQQKKPAEVQGKAVPQTAEAQGKLIPMKDDPRGKPVAATETAPKTMPIQ
jgi:hypothetical protein